MSQGNWFCKECDAHFEWFVYDETGESLRRPITDKDIEKSELFTDFGMNHREFYPIGEGGIELGQRPCSKCMEKIEEASP